MGWIYVKGAIGQAVGTQFQNIRPSAAAANGIAHPSLPGNRAGMLFIQKGQFSQCHFIYEGSTSPEFYRRGQYERAYVHIERETGEGYCFGRPVSVKVMLNVRNTTGTHRCGKRTNSMDVDFQCPARTSNGICREMQFHIIRNDCIDEDVNFASGAIDLIPAEQFIYVNRERFAFQHLCCNDVIILDGAR